MADPIKFEVELEDKASAPANKVADAMDRLSNEMHQGQVAAAALGDGVVKVKDPAEIAHRALDGVTAGVKGMVGAIVAGDAKGVVGGATEALAGLASALDLVVPGLGAAAAGVVKSLGGFAALGVGILETAAQANAAKAQWTATFDALGKGPDAGKKTLEMLSELGRELPQSGKQIKEWAREAAKMGVTDLGEMRREILATASAQAVLGEEGASAYQRVSRKVQDAIEGHHALKLESRDIVKSIGTNVTADVAGRMGLSLEKLEAGLKAGTIDARKFGVALEDSFISKGKKGLDALWLSNVWSKIESAGKGLFTGIDTAPITDALRTLLGLFDQTQPSGKAMKTTITDAFNGIAKSIGSVITEGQILAMEFMVWGLSMELALIPVWGILQKIGGAIKTAAVAIGSAGLGAPLAGLPAGGGGPAAPAAPKTANQLQGDALASTVGVLSALNPLAPLMGSKGLGIGNSIADGLVGGMQGSTDRVTAAANDLGATAVKGTKDGAGVHSPSLPAIEIGGYIDEGLGIGMLGGKSARAGRQLSSNALGGLVGGALTSPPANGNGGGLTVHIEHLTIQAPQGVTGAAELSATGLAVALERYQLASGR